VSSLTKIRRLNGKSIEALLIGAGIAGALASLALAAQDRYALRIPVGLAWSEFRGYETWQDVAVSQSESSLKVIAANDVMIKAFRDGVPENGRLFPDGSMITKIEWSFKQNETSPYFVNIPDTLKTVAFIVKDTTRFPNTHGWAYAQWAYDASTDTFKPSELNLSGTECGFACHSKVSARDYIWTKYPKR
jgi:hypothetical protein